MRVNTHILSMVEAQKRGAARGLYGICSAHPAVLEAAARQAAADGSAVLVESTSNQVNQSGGYTGMTPRRFAAFVRRIAARAGLPAGRLILGGDHIGPNAWQNEPAVTAMRKACVLVEHCVRAGYAKIHLDASMRCADDPAALPPETVAKRTAALCRAAEAARPPGGPAPVYAIGTEVPPPGGAKEQLETLRPTRPADAERTIALTRKAFFDAGLGPAWERVVAVVVQPGVEYGDATVFPYDAEKARPLSRLIEKQRGLVYEAHSTDFQTEAALARMVEDHFAVLKVGPWLTFAFREAVFALAAMEEELLRARKAGRVSRLRETLDRAMLRDPRHWAKYYHGSPAAQEYARKFSYSDRSRYYWPRPDVQAALRRLFANLARTLIPPTLLSQYMPAQYALWRQGRLGMGPTDLVRSKIMEVTGVYARACRMGSNAGPQHGQTRTDTDEDR